MASPAPARFEALGAVLDYIESGPNMYDADRLAFRLRHFLAWNRQAERAENAVGFFLVACQFDRDVRRASGDGRLDALLVFPMAELDQRLIVEPQPRNPAFLGGMHQRCG